MPENRKLKLESWDRFVTPNLTVEHALMGQAHSFSHQGATVTVSLPPSEQVTERWKETSPAWVTEHRIVNGNRVVEKVNIGSVDVFVHEVGEIALDEKVLQRPIKAIEIISIETQQRLDGIVKQASDIASNAFEHWLSILQWKAKNYRIGRPQIPDNKSGWATYLRDAESLRDVWASTRMFVVDRRDAVTTSEWEEIAKALEVGEQIPIFYKLLNDAREYHSRHEFRRSTIDLAIACEVFMRSTVLKRLPANLDADMRQIIEESNINQYVRKLFPNILHSEQRAKFKRLAADHLGALFDARNKIMHMAQYDRATGDNCVRFIKATETLFGFQAHQTDTP